MSEHADAVVVGAGLGGLAAAVALAGQGRRPVVLEQHSAVGGYAQCFQRGPYRFDASLHALNGLAPGGGADHVYRELGLWDRLRLRRIDPVYRLRLPARELVAPADWFGYEDEVVRHFPGQAGEIRGYLDEVLAVYRDTRRLETDLAAGRHASPAQLPGTYPALVRVSAETWEQMMARHVPDADARAVLGALWGYVGLPPSRCAAMVGAVATASYHEHGAWYPEGGAQALSNALLDELRARGGEVRYGELVTALEVAGDRAIAATTGAGLRLEGEVFVSNASAPTTMLELVRRGRLPTDYLTRVSGPTPSYTTFSVYLGLRRDVAAEHGLDHELFLPGGADPEADWQAAQRGDWARTSLSVTDYTRVDPGCAPPGHGVVVLTTVAPWDHQDVWGTGGDLADYHQNPRYLELKEQVTDVLLARAAEALPGLADAVAHREASTPLSNFFYTRNPRGAIEGFENSPLNAGAGWLPQRTPVRNLFLAGAWTTAGGMNPAMASGLAAARLAQQAAPTAAAR